MPWGLSGGFASLLYKELSLVIGGSADNGVLIQGQFLAARRTYRSRMIISVERFCAEIWFLTTPPIRDWLTAQILFLKFNLCCDPRFPIG